MFRTFFEPAARLRLNRFQYLCWTGCVVIGAWFLLDGWSGLHSLVFQILSWLNLKFDFAASQEKRGAYEVIASLVFIFVQMWGTAARFRHANIPSKFAVSLLFPAVNVYIVLVALLASVAKARGGEDHTDPVRWSSSLPFIVVVTVAVVGAIFIISLNFGDPYSAFTFLVIPLTLGFLPAHWSSLRSHRSLGHCCAVAALTTLVSLAAFFSIGVEGAICILMALPLIAFPVFLGALVAFLIQPREPHIDTVSPTLVSTVAFLPLAAIVWANGPQPRHPLIEVVTSVEIDAPPPIVWDNVVTFSPLEPPQELIFRTGIAYPIRAEITGHGVGAVRYCVFSTGPFVEPITAWDEDRLLAFDVTINPPTMHELSPYQISPPHLEGHFTSEKGQFRLIDLGGGRTRLEGTTWYRQTFGPGTYWRLWSDHIIHSIHNRVLTHIKTSAESQSL